MPFDRLTFFLPGLRDILEILIVAFLFYRFLLFMAGTRAIQILFGSILLALAYLAAFVLQFTMITYLMGLVFTYGAFAAVVVFQPELRTALARLGQTRLVLWFARSEAWHVADEVALAVDRLAKQATGAIVAVEGDMGLAEFLESGSPMDARISADLIMTIFTPNSPLHDGAIIVRGDRIVGAGAILPLTQFPVQDRSLGTRHRAALGLTEQTDALVIVVSEETSKISVAHRGILHRGVTPEQVRTMLSERSAGFSRGVSMAPARS